MVLTWISFRWTLSQRYLTTIILVSLLIFTFRSLFVLHPNPVHTPHVPLVSYHVPFDDFGLDAALCQGHLIEKDPDSKHGSLKPPLGTHTLAPDGLLIANPEGPHPIFQLMREAGVEWNTKLARASKTLEEAVAEYKRRYRRAPPLGFDKWWDYVVKHHVQLPDEYDEIHQDIEPFWGIDPVELSHIQEELETQPDTVTVEKTDTLPRFKTVNTTLPQNRQNLVRGIDDIIKLIHEVELDIPPIRITFSPFDNPNMVSDWQIKSMAVEAAANGMTLKRADMPPVKEGWVQACPPNSPARLHPPVLPSQSASRIPPSLPKTFIASHTDAMDPCLHPSLLTSHGQFLSHGKGPFPRPILVPRFSLCATLLHHDIRPPVPYGWDWDADADADAGAGANEVRGGAFEGDLPWDRKVDERLSWRGRTTGMWASPTSLWPHGHRARLVTLANTLEGNVSVLITGDGEEVVPVGEPEMMRLAHVNPAWMDIAFTEGPIACDERGGTCKEMEKMWEFRKAQGRREEGRYKFILDVDGNGWSGRFKRLISSNALVFKSTIYPEWYTSRIAPWVHYVPIQVSYADLYDAVAFFRAHDELAERIAKAGRDWSRRYWRRVDMTAYLYRLLLEYARVSSLNRSSMDYVG